MAKFFGELGYGVSTEIGTTGVWEDVIVEKSCYGDVIRNSRRLDDGSYVNDDITVNNSISIMADAEISNHFHAIKYVTWVGKRWVVSSVEVRRPRLILELGGIYNGPTPPAPVDP